jgi:hypothetical protein
MGSRIIGAEPASKIILLSMFIPVLWTLATATIKISLSDAIVPV